MVTKEDRGKENKGWLMRKIGEKRICIWTYWWVSVCLYPINVKKAESIGPKFFVGHHVTTGVMNDENKKMCFKDFNFVKKK